MTGPTTVPDLSDPNLYADRVPHDVFTYLRQNDPVYWNVEANGRGFWAITRYDDIVNISRQPQLFSSAHENGGHRIFDENDVAVAGAGHEHMGIPFISRDPPTHQRFRAVVVPGLTPARLQEMEVRIVARAQSLLDAIAFDETIDLLPAFAAPLPLLTLAELLGLPGEMWTKLFAWTNALVGEDDEDMRPSPELLVEFITFAEDLYRERRAKPGNDIASMLANAVVADQPMTMPDFVATMVLVLVGGNETTRNSIAHTVAAFAAHPDQWDLLRQNRELLPTAVREMVRYASPVMHMRRTAMADFELRGKTIRKKDRVLLWYPSGNRDEEKFERPFDFDVARGNIQHLGFGTGQHVCVGSRLAELQLRIAFGLLADRVKRFVVQSPPVRIKSNFINGLKSLKVELQAS